MQIDASTADGSTAFGDNFMDPYISNNCQRVILTRTGSRAGQPNKCVAVIQVPEGSQSPVQHSHRVGYTARLTSQYQADFARDYSIKEEKELLPPLLLELGTLDEEFRSKMGSPLANDGERRTAIVMVANEGVVDLLLNFICSSEAAGVKAADIVVFVGTKEVVPLIENMGASAIYSPALGSMPQRAAGGYLDDTFSRMMWFKTTSVYLAVRAGFNVLFQDVDLVWMKNPIPYLKAIDSDISFMDDGARTPRYTPFFVNSGFFFVKYNQRTLYFQEKMLKSGPSEIGYTHSHQSVLIRHAAEAHHSFGMKIYLLDRELFPSGQAYHEKKNFIKKIVEHTYMPYVFHMCWTSNRVDKVKYFKEIGLWYIPDTHKSPQCTQSRHMISWAVDSIAGQKKVKKGAKILDNCCDRTKYWSYDGKH